MKTFQFTLYFLFWLGNQTIAQSSGILPLADSLAKAILEKEGLYTVMGGLKPMSTAIQFELEIDSITQNYLDGEMANTRLQNLRNALDLMETDVIGFAIIPFKQIYGDKRVFQVLIYHNSSVREKIRSNSEFYLKRGILPNTPIAQVLTVTEFDVALPRFRSYGYLFGYPAHAVDFFVESADHQEKTEEFVKRDFFQIPVSSREDGHFVYAVPKGYEPASIDLELKNQALELLERYRQEKSKLMSSDQQFPFLELYWSLAKDQIVKRNIKQPKTNPS